MKVKFFLICTFLFFIPFLVKAACCTCKNGDEFGGLVTSALCDQYAANNSTSCSWTEQNCDFESEEGIGPFNIGLESGDNTNSVIPQVTIPGSEFIATQKIDLTKDLIAKYIARVYKYGVGITGILAFVMIMVGGIMWMMAGGSPDRVSNAKTYIAGALLGLILALSSYLLLQTVNPRLVNLEMPELPSIAGVSEICCCDENYCLSAETAHDCSYFGENYKEAGIKKCENSRLACYCAENPGGQKNICFDYKMTIKNVESCEKRDCNIYPGQKCPCAAKGERCEGDAQPGDKVPGSLVCCEPFICKAQIRGWKCE